MKAGDVINGYTILEDFKVVGAGLSKWTFAERGGQVLHQGVPQPTRIMPPAAPRPGEEARKMCGLRGSSPRCARALAPLSAYGGNLIVTLDFFRWGAKYYKVTEKVDASGFSAADVARLDFRTQLVLMKTSAHSLKILHDLRIVHGDLKPSNILIKKTDLGYTTKLIDFDSAYIAGSPPPAEEIVGTINYYSPGVARVHPGGRCRPEPARGRVRSVRSGVDLHRVPHRRAAALRCGDVSRAGGRGTAR